MKRALIAAFAAAGSLSPAFAADIPQAAPPVYRAPVVAPPPVVYNWTGFYLGVNGGGGWSRARGDDSATGDSLSFNMSGPLVGGQIGFNYQVGMFVLGAEFDGQWANIKGSVTNGTETDTVTMRSFITGRGRLGVAFDNFLLFATGGGAYVWGRTQFLDVLGTTDTFSWNRGGWTAGGGAEAGFGPWSIKAEYLYIDVRETSDTVTVRLGTHIVRAGLNYRFWSPVVSARF
jgi:outer membrane immunogenic protein